MSNNSCGIVLLLLGLLMMLSALSSAQDVNVMLQNKNLVNREIGCVLGRNPCDVIGKQIRGLLPEALNNRCARCTPQQIANAKKLMHFMKKNHPNEWNMIVKMYAKSPSQYY